MKMLIDQESRNSRGNFFQNVYHKKGIRYGRCQFESAVFKGEGERRYKTNFTQRRVTEGWVLKWV